MKTFNTTFNEDWNGKWIIKVYYGEYALIKSNVEYQNKNSDFHLLVGVLFLILCRFLWIFWVWFQGFIKNPIHLYGLITCGVVLMLIPLTLFIRKRKVKKKTMEKESPSISQPSVDRSTKSA